MLSKLDENGGLLNLRFYNGLNERFSEEFKNKTDKKELLSMQFEQADP